MALGVIAQAGCGAARLTNRPVPTSCRSVARCSYTPRLRRSLQNRAACVKSQRGATKARTVTVRVASGLVQQVSQDQLEKEITSKTVPLIIDFYATWCGPCVLLAKELEQVATDLGDQVKVLKIDVDQNPELSTQLQIQGLPTMVFIGMDPKKPALRTEGLLPAATIKQIVQDELSPAAAEAAPAATQ